MKNTKEYNKMYYESSKYEKGLKKINCIYCNKLICSNALKYHLETPKCLLSKLCNKIVEKKEEGERIANEYELLAAQNNI